MGSRKRNFEPSVAKLPVKSENSSWEGKKVKKRKIEASVNGKYTPHQRLVHNKRDGPMNHKELKDIAKEIVFSSQNSNSQLTVTSCPTKSDNHSTGGENVKRKKVGESVSVQRISHYELVHTKFNNLTKEEELKNIAKMIALSSQRCNSQDTTTNC